MEIADRDSRGFEKSMDAQCLLARMMLIERADRIESTSNNSARS